jgi:hypothetical protein
MDCLVYGALRLRPPHSAHQIDVAQGQATQVMAIA